MVIIFYLGSEYTKINDCLYTYYDKNLKMTIELEFQPKSKGVDVDVDVETRLTRILLRQYLKRELNTEYVSEDVLNELLLKIDCTRNKHL